VKPDGLNSLKLSKRIPTNKTRLKGLLTYRTIQFSMNSGRCRPKNSFPAGPFPHHILPASGSSASHFPNPGKKNLSADLIILNSASQSFVSFAAILFTLRRLSKTFFTFFAGVASSQLHLIYPYQSGCQKLFYTFFRRPNPRTRKDRMERLA
jgi:hypothetical protein